jgi:hypothetical protein
MFTKADQAREIGFAWLNGVEAGHEDCNRNNRNHATVRANRSGYPDKTSMYAAFVAGYNQEYEA